MSIIHGLFALACGVGLFRLLFVRRHEASISPAIDSREADAVHVVMNGAMAVMPLALLSVWSIIALGLTAAVLGLRLILAVVAGPAKPHSKGVTAYHLLSVLAMLYAMMTMTHGVPTEPMPMHHDMGPMHMQADQSVAHGNWLAILLGILFLLDGLLALGAGLFAPKLVMRVTQVMPEPVAGGTGVSPPFSRAGYLYAAFAHIVMDAGMAWMLLN